MSRSSRSLYRLCLNLNRLYNVCTSVPRPARPTKRWSCILNTFLYVQTRRRGQPSVAARSCRQCRARSRNSSSSGFFLPSPSRPLDNDPSHVFVPHLSLCSLPTIRRKFSSPHPTHIHPSLCTRVQPTRSRSIDPAASPEVRRLRGLLQPKPQVTRDRHAILPRHGNYRGAIVC